MKITLFTGDKIRHNYFIKLLSKNFDELHVLQEILPLYSGQNFHSKLIKEYFKNVENSQKKIFGLNQETKTNNINILKMKLGDINKIELSSIDNYLKSDIFVVYGSSFIKNDLLNFLIKKKALNIHMGISPYYRGTDCNFWALFDGNPHLVGSTIHYLSKGLDSGSILYHALSYGSSNLYDYTMNSVKSAFHSLVDKIKKNEIFDLKPQIQDKAKEIRYSKNIDFTEEKLKIYFDKEKKILLNQLKFDEKLLIKPYFFKTCYQ